MSTGREVADTALLKFLPPSPLELSSNWAYCLLYREKEIAPDVSPAERGTQPLFPDCQLLILLSYLACGFLNTRPVSLPVDLSIIATHLGGTRTSLKYRILDTGDAVLFPGKGKSFIWVRMTCFGQWLAGDEFLTFVFLKVTQVRALNDASSSVTDSLQLSHLGFETVAHVTGRQLFQWCFSGSPVF